MIFFHLTEYDSPLLYLYPKPFIINTMAKNKISLTQEDLLIIKTVVHEVIGELVEDIKKVHMQNMQLLEKLHMLILKIEKINIKEELIYETFIDVMTLVKVHNKKIRDLEKYLALHIEQ